MTSKEWEKYLLWGLALLAASGVSWFIWDDQKKKSSGGGGTGTGPAHAPLPPPPPPPATLPFQVPGTVPFGQGGTTVSFPVTGSGFDEFMHQAQTGTAIPVASVFTVQTTQTGAAGALRSHVQPDVNSPVNGTFAHGAQVTTVGEAPQSSADGRIWTRVSGTDAQTGTALLGWVDASYLGA